MSVNAPPPPVMKSNTSSKNTPINNDACVVNTGLYSGYIGSEQDKSSSLFGSICVPFFFFFIKRLFTEYQLTSTYSAGSSNQ